MEVLNEGTITKPDVMEEEITMVKEIEITKEIEIETVKESAKMPAFIPNLDVCFLLDCTGSMQSYIDRSKNKIKEIIEEVKIQYPETEIHVGVVGYRDIGDTNRFEVHHFSPNIQLAKNFIQKIQASGGNDAAEDINGGFQQAFWKMEWQGQAKMIVHIADAPCHGKEFHSTNDDYPNGHKDDKPWDEIFKFLVENHIDYLFLKINNTTDKMFTKFKEIAEAQGAAANGVLFKQEPISNIDQPVQPAPLFGGLSSYAPMTFGKKKKETKVVKVIDAPAVVEKKKKPRAPRSVSRKKKDESRSPPKTKKTRKAARKEESDSESEDEVKKDEEKKELGPWVQPKYWTRSKLKEWKARQDGEAKKSPSKKSKKSKKEDEEEKEDTGAGYWVFPDWSELPTSDKAAVPRRVRKSSASKERERSEERDRRTSTTPKKRGRKPKAVEKKDEMKEEKKTRTKKVVIAPAPKSKALKKLPSAEGWSLPPGMSAMDEAEYFSKLLSKEMKDVIHRKMDK